MSAYLNGGIMYKATYDLIRSAALSSAVLLVGAIHPMAASTQQLEAKPQMKQGIDSLKPWTEFHATQGSCSMSFPSQPEHISETMSVPEEGYDLRYDAYISSEDKRTVYMLLVAQYPDFVDDSYSQMSLEGFLNGILSHNPGHQLLFADLLLVNGHEALDFFIRTGNMYFKGRAMMVKNLLYLMAMECEVQSYDEMSFNVFINSFKLRKN